jgi:cytochrome P450
LHPGFSVAPSTSCLRTKARRGCPAQGRGGIVLELHEHARAQSARSSRQPPESPESLRFNTSARRFKRTVIRGTEAHGQKLRIGDKVALAFGSGNRDWRKFRDPDVYDIERRPQAISASARASISASPARWRDSLPRS